MQNWFSLLIIDFLKKNIRYVSEKGKNNYDLKRPKIICRSPTLLKEKQFPDTHTQTHTRGRGALACYVGTCRVQRLALGCIPQSLLYLFCCCSSFVWDNVSHWTWNSSFHLDWWLPRFASLCLPALAFLWGGGGRGFLRACAQQPLYWPRHLPSPWTVRTIYAYLLVGVIVTNAIVIIGFLSNNVKSLKSGKETIIRKWFVWDPAS